MWFYLSLFSIWSSRKKLQRSQDSFLFFYPTCDKLHIFVINLKQNYEWKLDLYRTFKLCLKSHIDNYFTLKLPTELWLHPDTCHLMFNPNYKILSVIQIFFFCGNEYPFPAIKAKKEVNFKGKLFYLVSFSYTIVPHMDQACNRLYLAEAFHLKHKY